MRALLAVVTLFVASACAPAPAGVVVRGTATAGPTCPVVTDPPDPACDDRPVSGAEIVARNEGGDEVTSVRTADDGSFSITLAPGRYELVPQVVDGLMQVAEPVIIVVAAGADPEPVALVYDTGIR